MLSPNSNCIKKDSPVSQNWVKSNISNPNDASSIVSPTSSNRCSSRLYDQDDGRPDQRRQELAFFKAPKFPPALHTSIEKTRLCIHLTKGGCTKKQCPFAHSDLELRQRPNLEKTKLCESHMATGRCNRGPSCKFAHGDVELRATPEFYKTALCLLFRNGTCRAGNFCRFAHGNCELRAQVFPSSPAAPKASFVRSSSTTSPPIASNPLERSLSSIAFVNTNCSPSASFEYSPTDNNRDCQDFGHQINASTINRQGQEKSNNFRFRNVSTDNGFQRRYSGWNSFVGNRERFTSSPARRTYQEDGSTVASPDVTTMVAVEAENVEGIRLNEDGHVDEGVERGVDSQNSQWVDMMPTASLKRCDYSPNKDLMGMNPQTTNTCPSVISNPLDDGGVTSNPMIGGVSNEKQWLGFNNQANQAIVVSRPFRNSTRYIPNPSPGQLESNIYLKDHVNPFQCNSQIPGPCKYSLPCSTATAATAIASTSFLSPAVIRQVGVPLSTSSSSARVSKSPYLTTSGVQPPTKTLYTESAISISSPPHRSFLSSQSMLPVAALSSGPRSDGLFTGQKGDRKGNSSHRQKVRDGRLNGTPLRSNGCTANGQNMDETTGSFIVNPRTAPYQFATSTGTAGASPPNCDCAKSKALLRRSSTATQSNSDILGDPQFRAADSFPQLSRRSSFPPFWQQDCVPCVSGQSNFHPINIGVNYSSSDKGFDENRVLERDDCGSGGNSSLPLISCSPNDAMINSSQMRAAIAADSSTEDHDYTQFGAYCSVGRQECSAGSCENSETSPTTNTGQESPTSQDDDGECGKFRHQDYRNIAADESSGKLQTCEDLYSYSHLSTIDTINNDANKDVALHPDICNSCLSVGEVIWMDEIQKMKSNSMMNELAEKLVWVEEYAE